MHPVRARSLPNPLPSVASALASRPALGAHRGSLLVTGRERVDQFLPGLFQRSSLWCWREARLEGGEQLLDLRDRGRVRTALVEEAQDGCRVVHCPRVDTRIRDRAARVGGGRSGRRRLHAGAPRVRVAPGHPGDRYRHHHGEGDRDERDQRGDAPAPKCEFSHGSSFRLDVCDAGTSVFECREHAEPFGYRRRRAVGIRRVSAPLTASSPRATLPWWVSGSSAHSRSRVGQLH